MDCYDVTLKNFSVGGQLSKLCVERGAENQILLEYTHTDTHTLLLNLPHKPGMTKQVLHKSTQVMCLEGWE